MNPSSRVPVEFDDRLVEAAVLLAMHGRHGDGFWRERDRIYEADGEEERDRRFRLICRRQFEELGLGEPFAKALDEYPALVGAVAACRVAPAGSRKEEGADLLVRAGSRPDDPESRCIAVRLRPGCFREPAALLAFLRRELFHIADMVDLAFAYDRNLPQVAGGPMPLQLVLNRYRVLWDTTIDGRLHRLGRAPASIREDRRRDFAATFGFLGEECEREFPRWFETSSPTHAALLSYAIDPAAGAGLLGLPGSVSRGICPLCRCPGPLQFADREPSADGLVHAVRSDFPQWNPAEGLCRQCADLYRMRPVGQR